MNFKSFSAFMFLFISILSVCFLSSFSAPDNALAAESGASRGDSRDYEYQLTTGEITVETDKTIYAPSDKIVLSVINSSTGPVFIHKNDSIAFHAIERLDKDGKWASLPARNPNTRYDIGPPEEFKAGEIYGFEWAPCFYERKEGKQNGYDIYEKTPFSPGKYRIVIIFQKRPSDDAMAWKWFLAYSNEFEAVR
jgi:hypothetical protein